MNKKVMIAWGFLVFSLLGCFFALGIITERQNRDYVKLENDLIENFKIYISNEGIVLDKNDSYELNINTLKKKGYVDSLEVNGDACKGSVLVKSEKGINTYKAYIKCGNYQSLEK